MVSVVLFVSGDRLTHQEKKGDSVRVNKIIDSWKHNDQKN